ncbi:hypothetical protein XENTR_v10004911 [Xenopus tropicalis]|uniref:Claudin n=1 Tax=Xenopus tropicalis TaxID=8364 RepID=A0A803K6U6_XENTR|nr:claudin-8 [Xenopus tropicalis]KAE8621654.1 hypothetical protein XENTR_v10004911 [Xenopus tropicalis]|eukprot:XP_002938492.1 PREDICTED: claudin-8-like [Xenopus tropicalis]
MAHLVLRIIGFLCGCIGMILAWVITLMPQWRVSIIAENNGSQNIRLDGQWISRFDGLWSTCINQAQSGQQCSSYDSMISITTDLKAGRVLMCFAVILSFLAFLFSFIGLMLTRYQDKYGKHCLILTAGILYIVSIVLMVIPVIWVTSNIVTQACEPYCKGGIRIELGEALFLAWPAVGFLLVGGIILCWACPKKHRKETCIYTTPQDQEMVYRVRPTEGELRNCYNKNEYI